MQRLPWISSILAAIVLFNPIGINFIRNAFWSNEQLSRNIATPFVIGAFVVLGFLVAIEVLVRYWRLR